MNNRVWDCSYVEDLSRIWACSGVTFVEYKYMGKRERQRSWRLSCRCSENDCEKAVTEACFKLHQVVQHFEQL